MVFPVNSVLVRVNVKALGVVTSCGVTAVITLVFTLSYIIPPVFTKVLLVSPLGVISISLVLVESLIGARQLISYGVMLIISQTPTPLIFTTSVSGLNPVPLIIMFSPQVDIAVDGMTS